MERFGRGKHKIEQYFYGHQKSTIQVQFKFNNCQKMVELCECSTVELTDPTAVVHTTASPNKNGSSLACYHTYCTVESSGLVPRPVAHDLLLCIHHSSNQSTCHSPHKACTIDPWCHKTTPTYSQHRSSFTMKQKRNQKSGNFDPKFHS